MNNAKISGRFRCRKKFGKDSSTVWAIK